MSGLDDDNLRADLNALLDGALPDDRAAELRALIESDDEVRREYDALRRVVEAVRALPRETAPPELRERLRSATAGVRRPAPILRWAAPLAAAAAILVAVMLSVGDKTSTELPDEARAEKNNGAEEFLEQDEGATADAEFKKDIVGAKPGARSGRTDGGDRPRRKAPAEDRSKVADNVDRDSEAPEITEAEKAERADEADSEANSGMDDRTAKPQAGKPAPAPKKGRKGRGLGYAGDKEPGRKNKSEADEKPDPVAAVQAGAVIKTSPAFKGYVRALVARKPADIVAHIRSFGITREKRGKADKERAVAKETKAKKTARRGVAVLSAQLADKEEARLLSDVLKRAFPLVPKGATVPGAPAAGIGGGGGDRPSSTATLAGPTGGKLILQVRVTELQRRILRGWLDRISVAKRARRSDGSPRARVSRGLAGAQATTELQRVELRYPLPKRD